MRYLSSYFIVGMSVQVFGEINNAELAEFLARYEYPETVKALTRCEVNKLQHLLRQELDSDPEYLEFMAKNASLPVSVEYLPGDAASDEPTHFDGFLGDLDRRIEALLDEFYGPISAADCGSRDL